MLLSQILIESTPGQLLKRKGVSSALENRWSELYGEQVDADDIMVDLVGNIPHGLVNNYIEWVTSMFLTDPSFDIDDRDIPYVIRAHHNNKQHLLPDPMMYKTYGHMLGDLRSYEDSSGRAILDKVKKRNELQKDKMKDHVKELIPGKLYQMDKEGAYKFGPDSWCISNTMRGEEEAYNYFNKYSNKGQEPFFLLSLPELDPLYSKIGIFPGPHGSKQFRDRLNNNLSIKQIHQIWEQYPEVYKALEPYIGVEDWKTDLEVINN